MTYDPRAEYIARQMKAAEEAGTNVSQEDGHVDAGNIENESAKGEVDATVDASKNTGEEVVVASSEGALADTEKAAEAAEDHAEVVAGTAPDSERKEVDASKDAADCGEPTEIASTEEIDKLPEQTEGSENVAETETNASEISTQEPEIATKAEEAPESPVEPYNTSESPEALAKGVVSDVKKIETGVTQVLNEDRAISELENVATEMRAIIAEKGAMTSAESKLFNVAVQNALKNLPGAETDLPSMESFADQSVSAFATELSLEGILNTIRISVENFGERLDAGLADVASVADSIVPLLDRIKKRAEGVRGKVNDSNREDGLKTLSGDFISALYLEGRVPEADTVVKTVGLLDSLSKEVFAKEVLTAAESAVGETAKDPDLFKLFPTVAKLNHSTSNTAAEEALDIKRSETLFGDKALAVSAFKSGKQYGQGQEIVPQLVILDLNEEGSDSEIQTLTSKQQEEVLDGVIGAVTPAIEYYTNFAEGIKGLQAKFSEAYGAAKAGEEDSQVATYAVEGVAKTWARGVFVGQTKFAQYLGEVGEALISYVDKSTAATQADTEDEQEADENRVEAET